MICHKVSSAPSNTFKNSLNTQNRIGFFMDQPVHLAHWPHAALIDFCRAGAAAPGELPGENTALRSENTE